MATSEELRNALASKEVEAAELERNLLDAAQLGQELIAENEKLKERLAAQELASSTPRGQSRSRSSTPDRCTRDLDGSDDEEGETLSRSRLRPRMETSSSLGDRKALEEEHLALQRRCAELEAELEDREPAMGHLKTSATVMSRAPSASVPLSRLRQSLAQQNATSRECHEEVDDWDGSASQSLVDRSTSNLAEIEELFRQNEYSEAQVEELRMQLRQQTAALAQANARCGKFQEESKRQASELAQAEGRLAAHSDALEVHNLQKSARMMRQSLDAIGHRASQISSHAGDEPRGLPGQVWRSQGDEPRGFDTYSPEVCPDRSVKSLMDDLGTRGVEELERENEELADTIAELQSQLDRVSTQEGESEQAGGGADAGGGSSSGSHATQHLADPEAVTEIRTELTKVRAELDEANMKLMRRRMSRVESLRGQQLQNKEPEPDGLWERWLTTWFSVVCCREQQRPAS